MKELVFPRVLMPTAERLAGKEVAVFGISHELRGEAVRAVVVLREDAVATGMAIIEHARERLAAYRVPQSIDIVDGPGPESAASAPDPGLVVRMPSWVALGAGECLVWRP